MKREIGLSEQIYHLQSRDAYANRAHLLGQRLRDLRAEIDAVARDGSPVARSYHLGDRNALPIGKA